MDDPMAGEVLSRDEYLEFKDDVLADVEVDCLRSGFYTARLEGVVGYCDALELRAEAAERERDELKRDRDVLVAAMRMVWQKHYIGKQSFTYATGLQPPTQDFICTFIKRTGITKEDFDRFNIAADAKEQT